MLPPSKEETQIIAEFLNNMQDYPAPIPDNVMIHLLSDAGLNTTDPRVHRTINAAVQKFINDILVDCASCAKKNHKEKGKKDKLDLTVYDLKEVLQTRNIQIHRPDFIVSFPQNQKN